MRGKKLDKRETEKQNKDGILSLLINMILSDIGQKPQVFLVQTKCISSIIWNMFVFDKNGSKDWNRKPDESLMWWSDFVRLAVSGWWIVGGNFSTNQRSPNYQLTSINKADKADHLGQGRGAIILDLFVSLLYFLFK